MRVALVLLAISAGSAAAQDGRIPQDLGNEVEEVVVEATRTAPTIAKTPPPDPDPLDIFRDFCFEPNRLQGLSARPVGDPSWRRLGDRSRERLNAHPSSVIYVHKDAARGRTMLLWIQERPSSLRLRSGLVEHRCSLTVEGGDKPQVYRRGLSGLFHGAGGEHHVGHPAAPGFESIPGWRQVIWSMVPPRGHTRWRVFGGGGGFVALTGPTFFQRYDYVAGELKHNEDAARPVSVLSLTHTFRPAPGRKASDAAPRIRESDSEG